MWWRRRPAIAALSGPARQHALLSRPLGAERNTSALILTLTPSPVRNAQPSPLTHSPPAVACSRHQLRRWHQPWWRRGARRRSWLSRVCTLNTPRLPSHPFLASGNRLAAASRQRCQTLRGEGTRPSVRAPDAGARAGPGCIPISTTRLARPRANPASPGYHITRLERWNINQWQKQQKQQQPVCYQNDRA